MHMARSSASPRRRLDRKDWTEEALSALSRGGLAAVAVEPIAQRLGATKGSFYHHFGNRDDLIGAALELWEQRHTAQVNAEVDAATDDPRERLRLVTRRAIRMAETDPIGLNLLASADNPLVAPVLERVTTVRLDYLARLYRRLGQSPATARRHALLAYSAYLGHVQLAHSTPAVLPRSPAARHAYLDLVLAALDPDPAPRPVEPDSDRGA
jgi:AcrR family transcriptional regulator